VESHRDPRNPEAVIYPGSLTTKILVVVALSLCLLLAISAVASPEGLWVSIIDGTLIAGLVLLSAVSWPAELVTDQFGIHSLRPLGIRSVHIPWREVGEVGHAMEFGGLGARLGLQAQCIVIQDAARLRRVVHTPRHPDPKRLLLELKQHGVHAETVVPA
jgi:hypothetical protein